GTSAEGSAATTMTTTTITAIATDIRLILSQRKGGLTAALLFGQADPDRRGRVDGVNATAFRPGCTIPGCCWTDQGEENMTFHQAALVPALLCLFAVNSIAQTPAAAPPAVPADVSPLYVLTYVEARPSARDDAAALLKSYREASRSSTGNLRSVVVRSVVRPGQFVVVAA